MTVRALLRKFATALFTAVGRNGPPGLLARKVAELRLKLEDVLVAIPSRLLADECVSARSAWKCIVVVYHLVRRPSRQLSTEAGVPGENGANAAPPVMAVFV